MTRIHPARRGGFTLLEVLLASALAVILMAALYVALDVQLRLAAAGRDSIEQATLTRAITMRLEHDLAGGLGPVAPPIDTSGQQSGGMGGGAGGSSGSGTGGGSAGGTAATASEDDAGAAADMGVVVDATMSDTIPFQAGVIGTADQLTIYAAHVAGTGKTLDETGDGANPADARRVTYWMTETGLARQELPWLTSQDLQMSTDPRMEDGKEERDYVIAEEVTRIQFEYWDGSAWSESWDGRTMSSGQTLRGPPMAIRVRFWLKAPGPNPRETVEKEYRHTIAVRAAAGLALPEMMSRTQP